ncbi:MAG: hypothetical protein ABI718_07870 [Acidobacteriota bacterium]
MRLTLRKSLVLTIVLMLSTAAAFADHLEADCPLSLVATTSASSPFSSSPHGVFRNGTVVYQLRGDRLTTFNITALGDVQVARDDLLDPLVANDVQGGVTYSNGYLFVSSGAGLEIFDLRNVKGGPTGVAPISVSKTPGMHYRRLTVMGNLLAALYPQSDIPCVPNGSVGCSNAIDLISIADLTLPTVVGRISAADNFLIGFDDIVFANGYLYSTGLGGTFAFDVSNPGAPGVAFISPVIGNFLATNGTSLLAIGQQKLIGVFTIGPGALLNYFNVFTLPSIFNRQNELMFHPEATFDTTHLITMVDEKDPQTGRSARTIAFDVFDFTVPFFEGSDDRIYENVTPTLPDEVKFDPLAVGPYIYVNGEVSGMQKWGACGQIAGDVEFETPQGLACGGAELHGFVVGAQRILRVEVFLDSTSLGTATLGGRRTDISDTAPVISWRLPVNLDLTERGSHDLRIVGTDAAGNTRQFASRTIVFNGPGQNCTGRRRGAKQ